MRVSVINFNLPRSNSIKSGHNLRCTEFLNSSSNAFDVFEKTNSNISFCGKDKNDNLADSLAIIGLVGGTTLLSIAAGVAMAKDEDIEEIFADEDGYTIDNNDLSVKSDKVIADADDGIFKVEGTGIDINPDRFSGHGDIFDPEHGIYRTADGSIDIDLLNNKYIDTHNGIFVDPDEKISTLVDEDGEVKHFVLPSFAGYQTWPYPLVTRNDDDSIGEEGFLEKFANSPLISGIKDLFDRDVVMATDDDGNEYPSTMPENLSRVHGASGSLDDLSQDANDSKFDDYLEEHFPTMEQFISELQGRHTDEEQDDDSDAFGQGELFRLMNIDDNDNGIPDFLEGDINGNGIPDYQDEDLDGDGIPDFLE